MCFNKIFTYKKKRPLKCYDSSFTLVVLGTRILNGLIELVKPYLWGWRAT